MIGYIITAKGHKITITNSKGDWITSDDLYELLDYLLSPQGGEFRVFWDIDQSLSQIFRLMDRDVLESLFRTNRAWFSPYGITFHRRKSFYIVKGSYRAFYYNLGQYYPDVDEPENPVVIKEYGDALLTELASIGVHPERLSSPIGLFDSIYERIPLPKWDDAPDEVGELADQCTRKQWTEAIQIGYFDKAFDFDIGSAYPSVAATLLDYRYGTWVNSKEIPSDAVYGFAQGKVKVAVDISPIIYTDSSGHLSSPRGKWTTVLTLGEIKMIDELQLGSFDIDYAWWWIPSRRVYPLQLTMSALFNSRKNIPILDKILKLAMNGIYGKMLQINDDDTNSPSYNPIWASIIEAETRIKMARTIYGNDLTSHILHLSTDGMLLDKEVAITGNGKMGEWKLDSSSPALIVSSSDLFYGKKRPHQLTFVEAMELIKAKPKDNNWERIIRRRITIGDYLLSGDDIGLLKEFTTGFRLTHDHDRIFSSLPRNGSELLANHYISKPLQARRLK